MSNCSAIRLRSSRRKRQDRGKRGGRKTAGYWAHTANSCSAIAANHFWVSPMATILLIWALSGTRKSGVFYTSQSANRSKGQAYVDQILTNKADRRLVRCVNVHQPLLEAPEPYQNLVYAKVRIPRRLAPNRKKGTSGGWWLTRTLDASLRTQWLPQYHQYTMAPASVTSPSTRPTSCFLLWSSWHRAQCACAEHRIGARVLVWRMRWTKHGNREKRRGGAYA